MKLEVFEKKDGRLGLRDVESKERLEHVRYITVEDGCDNYEITTVELITDKRSHDNKD